MTKSNNETRPNWKKMAEQLNVSCDEICLIESCEKLIWQKGGENSPLLKKVDAAYNDALERRNNALTALVMALTDLDEKGAGELIEQGTQHIYHSTLAARIAHCAKPPIIKYGFGWWFNFDDDYGPPDSASHDGCGDEHPF